jgi:hypothetical protein
MWSLRCQWLNDPDAKPERGGDVWCREGEVNNAGIIPADLQFE